MVLSVMFLGGSDLRLHEVHEIDGSRLVALLHDRKEWQCDADEANQTPRRASHALVGTTGSGNIPISEVLSNLSD